MAGVREEVINVALAELLSDRGVVSTPEVKEMTSGGIKLPDVVVSQFRGLRTIVEGKINSGAAAEKKVLEQAAERVEQGLAHIGIAVMYDRSVGIAGGYSDVKAALVASNLKLAVCTESGMGAWSTGNVDHLGSLLRRTFDELVKEDVVRRSVDDLSQAVDVFAKAVAGTGGSIDRCARALGVPPDDENPKGHPVYSKEQRFAVSRISGLTLLNAMLFQEVLSADEPRAEGLRKSLAASDFGAELIAHWRFIVDDIDYFPIFNVARELLVELPATNDVDKALRFLGDKALTIVSRRAALRHDLMGRVYHRLLVEKKFLATFYTSVPAATLLLKLALAPNEWRVDWSDFASIEKFKLADLACGTGTLLMASAEAITDNYVTAASARGSKPDLAVLHRHLMEDVIHGYDVLPSALHLTASTLALRSAGVAFKETHLFSLPHGGIDHALGSIEFLRHSSLGIKHDLFGQAAGVQRVTGSSSVTSATVRRPTVDLCVMNPPFTRTAGENLLFGSVPPKQRKKMTARLGALIKGDPEPGVKGARRRVATRQPAALASATAGLASVFMAVGHETLKTNGRMALVVPVSLVSGIAWGKSRELLRGEYQVEYLVVSHDPERWNFSDNTDLSEVLVVARKVGKRGTNDGRVTCLNLWHNSTTAVEAMSVAESLLSEKAPDIATGQGAVSVTSGSGKVGEAVALDWSEFKDTSWGLPVAFAHAELIRAAYHLHRGTLYVPGKGTAEAIPLCRLDELGELGPDRRDIWDGFEESSTPTTFPAVWGHVAETMKTLHRQPNRYLAPLPGARTGRPLRKALDLWKKAGRIVLAERAWLNTIHQLAVRLDEPVLANVWWPLALQDDDEDAEKALMMWLNSSLGLLLALADRQETRGAWVNFKKPVWLAMQVLDTRTLTAAQKSKLAAVFDSLQDEQLLPLPKMASDPYRRQIDEALEDALGLTSLEPLRNMLGEEPVITLHSLA